MRGSLDIQDKQHKRKDDKDQAKPVDWQHAQPIGRQRQAHHAEKTGHPSAGAGDFDQDRLHADRDQQEDNIGVGEHHQKLFDERQVEGDNISLRRVQRLFAGQGDNHEAVHLAQQVVQVAGNPIDQPGLQRLVRRDSRRRFDHLLCQGYCFCAAPLNYRAHLCPEHILELGFHCFPQVFAAAAHRAGRADSRLGRHGRPMSCQGQQGAGAGCHRSRRRNIHHDGHCTVVHRLHNAQHNIHIAAGGVQLDHHGFCASQFSRADAAFDIFGHRRRYRGAGVQQIHLGPAVLSEDAPGQRQPDHHDP